MSNIINVHKTGDILLKITLDKLNVKYCQNLIEHYLAGEMLHNFTILIKSIS